jgi:phosphoglycerate dehydrogenase-like enzyme
MTTICLPGAQALTLLDPLPDGVEALVWDGRSEPPEGIERTEFLVPPYAVSVGEAAMLDRMPNLRIIQLLSAGAEAWIAVLPDGVALHNGRGIHGASTAELALAGLLSVLRRLPTYQEQQRERVWKRADASDLASRRVLVLGAGDIGDRIGAAVRIFGAAPTMVARRPREGVRTLDELPGLLPVHDVVVVALPHTAETHRLVDAEFLAALPDGAVLVNIARGPLVDTDALLSELRAGRLRAFLDVTDPEPLPADHPLWGAPGLVLTPHVGGGTSGWAARGYGLVGRQLAAFRAGEPLVNRVEAGY